MSHNVGLLDRALRFGLAGILLLVGLTAYSGTATGVILIVGAIIPTLTAILRTCPVYSIFGLRTCRMQ